MSVIIDNLLGNDDLSRLGKPYAEATVDQMNTEKRLPSILLVDTSRSMRLYKNLLKESVEGVYDAILRDRKASNVTELGVMTFNSEIQILEKMREIKKQKEKGRNLDFECEGIGLTGLAMKAALAHLEARKETYRNARPMIRHYAPILFFISDGKPECFDDAVKPQEDRARQQCIAYIRKQVAENRLVVVSVEIGDHCGHALMAELTGLPDDRHVIQLRNPEAFSKFVKFLVYSIVMAGHPGNQSINDFNFNQFLNF